MESLWIMHLMSGKFRVQRKFVVIFALFFPTFFFVAFGSLWPFANSSILIVWSNRSHTFGIHTTRKQPKGEKKVRLSSEAQESINKCVVCVCAASTNFPRTRRIQISPDSRLINKQKRHFVSVCLTKCVFFSEIRCVKSRCCHFKVHLYLDRWIVELENVNRHF